MTSYKIGDRIRIENRIFEACKSVCDFTCKGCALESFYREKCQEGGFTCNGEETNIIFKEISLSLHMKEVDV